VSTHPMPALTADYFGWGANWYWYGWFTFGQWVTTQDQHFWLKVFTISIGYAHPKVEPTTA